MTLCRPLHNAKQQSICLRHVALAYAEEGVRSTSVYDADVGVLHVGQGLSGEGVDRDDDFLDLSWKSGHVESNCFIISIAIPGAIVSAVADRPIEANQVSKEDLVVDILATIQPSNRCVEVYGSFLLLEVPSQANLEIHRQRHLDARQCDGNVELNGDSHMQLSMLGLRQRQPQIQHDNRVSGVQFVQEPVDRDCCFAQRVIFGDHVLVHELELESRQLVVELAMKCLVPSGIEAGVHHGCASIVANHALDILDDDVRIALPSSEKSNIRCNEVAGL
mmetsp:Transcript_61554/g.200872  ORF Transcript_61554/g.200872 Transcript_61554/m.200872 type:complete len:277 (+) Transcript_61554:517-1347(+)